MRKRLNDEPTTVPTTTRRLGSRGTEELRRLPEVRRVRGPRPRVLESSPVHFTEEVAAYDDMIRRYAWLLNKPFVEMLSKLNLERGRVLDLGTGPGWIPIELAKRKPGWEIWALDASADMLAEGERRARAAGVGERIHFVEGDATKLGFGAGEFDLVYSHFVLHHMDRPEVMFNEAARVTRGGGKVVIKDLLRQPNLKTRFLLWFSKYVLRYSELQMQMYEESMDAALTFAEVREALRRSKLCMAKVSAFRGLDFVVES